MSHRVCVWCVGECFCETMYGLLNVSQSMGVVCCECFCETMYGLLNVSQSMCVVCLWVFLWNHVWHIECLPEYVCGVFVSVFVKPCMAYWMSPRVCVWCVCECFCETMYGLLNVSQSMCVVCLWVFLWNHVWPIECLPEYVCGVFVSGFVKPCMAYWMSPRVCVWCVCECFCETMYGLLNVSQSMCVVCLWVFLWNHVWPIECLPEYVCGVFVSVFVKPCMAYWMSPRVCVWCVCECFCETMYGLLNVSQSMCVVCLWVFLWNHVWPIECLTEYVCGVFVSVFVKPCMAYWMSPRVYI